MAHEYTDTVVIGGGQSGLAMSYCLTQRQLPHVVLERGRVGERWRTRWDSVTLQFPNSRTRLPGSSSPGADPFGFLGRDEVVRWLEDYAASFNPPLRGGVAATSLTQPTGTPHYLIETTEGTIATANVVIASGPYQVPDIPAAASAVPADIFQLHSEQYSNPAQLPPGAVLVVGSGASGSQIAEELLNSGRRVYLAVGRHRRLPRRYRGQDGTHWMATVRGPEPASRDTSAPATLLLTGVRGGYDINLRDYAARGMVLLGRFTGIAGSVAQFAPGLEDDLRYADEAYWTFLRQVDEHIERNGIAAPEERWQETLAPADESVLPIRELDLNAAGISTVLWATGFKYDFDWVRVPIFGDDGEPVQQRGVTEYPGLYVLGLYIISKRSSSFDGMADDAEYLAGHIAARSRATVAGTSGN